MLSRLGGGSGSATGDDAGKHPKHTGAVQRDVFRLGISLEPQFDHEHFPAVQTVQALASPAEGIQPARKAVLKIGVGRGTPPDVGGRSEPCPAAG